ncbi:DUF4870 domain-containing protein [Methylacidimicrobium tartarophylax]|uniref:DUF4870 domain-containing protein n=1 Tax=Methylacidimicrobium tartarophylax TaxID=1041768 RepID=A0A5E6ME28_9BACT|nr:DUF4870 domain-containing protein [Methylacidimicrobium tartarophylax]VVM06606.1 hypothetical protein MAMT_01314 [Methylacidimicrobium tartarophylax]
METDNSEGRNLALLAHLAPIFGYLITIGQILIPLLIYLLAKETFAKKQAREALNAQITFTIYFLAAGLLCFVLIGFPLLLGLGIFVLWTMISAAIAVSKGVSYRYPLIFRFVS